MATPLPIYLDYAATTPLNPRVAEAMHQAMLAGYANPASQHKAGREARRVLEEARESIARRLGAQTSDMQVDRVVLTCGGTEANLLALWGLAGPQPQRIVISSIEHSSLIGAADVLRSRGIRVDLLPVLPSGLCDWNRFIELIDAPPKPDLVGIIHTNNETGVIQPTVHLAIECAKRSILFHTDAAHAMDHWLLWPEAWFSSLEYAAITIVPHKFGGPLGIGALVVRHGVKLEPLLPGGFHQGGMRAGTESIPLAVGLQVALEALATDAPAERLAQLSRVFETRLHSELEEVVIVGKDAPRAAHISNIAFLGVDRQQLFLALDFAGVYCSTGSACASGSSEPSPVLRAMGLPEAVISSSLRFSFGMPTTLDEVHEATDRIVKCVNDLRSRKSARK